MRFIKKNDQGFQDQMAEEDKASKARFDYEQRRRKRLKFCKCCNNNFYHIKGIRQHDFGYCSATCFVHRSI